MFDKFWICWNKRLYLDDLDIIYIFFLILVVVVVVKNFVDWEVRSIGDDCYFCFGFDLFYVVFVCLVGRGVDFGRKVVG